MSALQPVVVLRYGTQPDQELVERLRALMAQGQPFHVDTHEVLEVRWVESDHAPDCPKVQNPEVTCVCGALAVM